ncbi:MAG: hypothetical protein NG747_08500 [Candidatus Brocadia sp.]|nr:hypothetical protein [Candidatus Brocadia sp.]
MTDTSNDKKHTDRLKKKKGWLISFNIAISIIFSGVLVWLLAYTPLVPEKEFHVKLFDFLKYAPYNTSQSREEFKNKLLEFLKTNQYDPFRSEKKFKIRLFAFLIKNQIKPSPSEEGFSEFKNNLLAFLKNERTMPDKGELKDARKESRHDWMFIRTLAAMFVGGAIGGILCNLCNDNLIAYLRSNLNNTSSSEIEFSDNLLDFVKKDRNKNLDQDSKKAFEKELLAFLKCNQYEPSQTAKEFENKLHGFLEVNPCKSSQSEEDFKKFKNNLLVFLRNNRQDPSSIELYFRPIKGAVTGLLVFFVGNLLVTSLSIDATQKGWETLYGRLPYIAIAILSGYAAPEFMARLKKLAVTMFSETEKNK